MNVIGWLFRITIRERKLIIVIGYLIRVWERQSITLVESLEIWLESIDRFVAWKWMNLSRLVRSWFMFVVCNYCCGNPWLWNISFNLIKIQSNQQFSLTTRHSNTSRLQLNLLIIELAHCYFLRTNLTPLSCSGVLIINLFDPDRDRKILFIKLAPLPGRYNCALFVF